MPTCAVCGKFFPFGDLHSCLKKDGNLSHISTSSGDCMKCFFNPCRCNDSDGNYEWSVIQDKRRYSTHLSDVEFMKNKIAEAAFGRNISSDLYIGAMVLAEAAIALTNSFDDAVQYCLKNQHIIKKK